MDLDHLNESIHAPEGHSEALEAFAFRVVERLRDANPGCILVPDPGDLSGPDQHILRATENLLDGGRQLDAHAWSPTVRIHDTTEDGPLGLALRHLRQALVVLASPLDQVHVVVGGVCRVVELL